MKTMLKPPLLDATIPEDRLADWIDAHTMRVHGFLDRLQQVIIRSVSSFNEADKLQDFVTEPKQWSAWFISRNSLYIMGLQVTEDDKGILVLTS